MHKNINTHEKVLKYLSENYVTIEQLALATSISCDELESMVAAEIIPCASYRFLSKAQIFSNLSERWEDVETKEIQFYPLGIIKWVKMAVGYYREQANGEIYLKFEEEFIRALVKRPANVYGFSDLFSPELCLERAKLEARKKWMSMMRGIFGICIKGEISADAIVRKGIAVERVAKLTDDGAKVHLEESNRALLVEALMEFDQIVSNFGPHDWERSSRKRLFDDLVPRFALEREFPHYRTP